MKELQNDFFKLGDHTDSPVNIEESKNEIPMEHIELYDEISYDRSWGKMAVMDDEEIIEPKLTETSGRDQDVAEPVQTEPADGYQVDDLKYFNPKVLFGH